MLWTMRYQKQVLFYRELAKSISEEVDIQNRRFPLLRWYHCLFPIWNSTTLLLQKWIELVKTTLGTFWLMAEIVEVKEKKNGKKKKAL